MDHDVIDLEEQRKKEKHYVKQSERISRPTEQQSSMEDRDFDAMFVNINSLISRRDLNRLWGIFRTEKHIILERKYKDSPDNEQLQPEPEQESGSEEKHSDQSLLHLQIDSGEDTRSEKPNHLSVLYEGPYQTPVASKDLVDLENAITKSMESTIAKSSEQLRTIALEKKSCPLDVMNPSAKLNKQIPSNDSLTQKSVYSENLTHPEAQVDKNSFLGFFSLTSASLKETCQNPISASVNEQQSIVGSPNTPLVVQSASDQTLVEDCTEKNCMSLRTREAFPVVQSLVPVSIKNVTYCHVCKNKFKQLDNLNDHIVSIHTCLKQHLHKFHTLHPFSVQSKPMSSNLEAQFQASSSRVSSYSVILGQENDGNKSAKAVNFEENDRSSSIIEKKDCSVKKSLKQNLNLNGTLYCENCSVTFTKYLTYSKHICHSNSVTFKCSLCPKAFKANAHLASHLRSHNNRLGNKHSCQSNSESFKCSHCPKAFKAKAHLASHRRSHNNGLGKKNIVRKRLQAKEKLKIELKKSNRSGEENGRLPIAAYCLLPPQC